MFDGKSGNEKAPQRRDFLHYLLRIRTEDDLVVGVPGIEPGNGGTKNRCLTAWLHPNTDESGRLQPWENIKKNRFPQGQHNTSLYIM